MSCANPKCCSIINDNDDILCDRCYQQLKYVSHPYPRASNDGKTFMYVDGFKSMSDCDCLVATGWGDSEEIAKISYYSNLFRCKHH